jgi:hypothetical protein
MNFNEENKGYRIVIEGLDGGNFALKVTLNWYFAFSDIESSDPMPLLTSSHMRHELNHCDKERSEIYSSGVRIVVDRQG